jgi:hypothetical protein
MSDRWATVQARVEITANQSPENPTTLFDAWLVKGWQVINVTVLPPQLPTDMCLAIGVLRKPDPDVIR